VPRQFKHRPSAAEFRQAIETDSTGQPAANDREVVVQTLRNLLELQGLPFYYLVPDATMLPPESIRFFQVDENWLTALADGALSLGGTAPSGATEQVKEEARARRGQARAEALKVAKNALNFTTMSGFLLRSAVVVGWPGLEVNGYSDTAGTQPLQRIRLELVSPSVMLGLFEGTVQCVKIHEPAEGIHFGTSTPTTVTTKSLRYAADGQSGSGISIGQPIPNFDLTINQFRGFSSTALMGTNRIVNINALATAMSTQVFPSNINGNFTGAEFALEMVQGVEEVTFSVPSE